MFAAAECLFLYLESSLRVGAEEAGDEVDRPIQREVATGYPVVPASSLKGALRGRARLQQATVELIRLLGSAPESDQKEPSSLSLSDALPLLFPVRALVGLFAWVTSQGVWSRFQRDLAAYGVQVSKIPELPVFSPEKAGVAPESPFVTGKQTVVLEEMSFVAQPTEEVRALGDWLADQAFPDESSFDFWRERVRRGVVLLPEAPYRYFVEHATQITPRIRIDAQTGTAAEGSLWTEEYLPAEALLYALAGANLPEEPAPVPGIKKPADIIDWAKGLAPHYLQLGGGQTLGHGIVRLRWSGKKLARRRKGARAKKS